MPITLGLNIAALKAQSELSKGTNALSKVFERLSSGQRINRASDDPAGLSLATSLSADARVFTQGVRNLSDGVSLLNVGYAALTELSSIVTRQKELAEQAANGTYTAAQRRALHTEADALTDEFNRIIGTTSYNGITLFTSSLSEIQLQAGSGSLGSIALNLGQELARTSGSGSFAAAQLISHGSQQRTVASGDLNEDGILDIAVAGSGGTAIRLGNGDGTFLASLTVDASPSASVVVYDANGDGNLDVIDDRSEYLNVSLGNGDGTFKASSVYGVSLGASNAVQMSVGDLNGDDVMDIVAATTAGVVEVYLGNSNGSFSLPTSYPGPAAGVGMALGDFNEDGILDMAYGQYTGSGISVRFGVGDGTFGAVTTWSTTSFISHIEIYDFNRDGHTDLLMGGVGVMLGNGDGTFTAENRLQAGAASSTAADLNGDGFADIIGSNYPSDSVSIYLSNGDGTFTGRGSIATGAGGDSYEIEAGDFNGDGIADLIVTDYTANSMAYFRGLSQTRIDQEYFSLYTQDDALAALTVINDTADRVELELGNVGAMLSRVEVAMSNLSSMADNYRMASSRILDADIATDTAELVRRQILQKSATAILAQANLQPSLVLSLLQE